MAPVSKLLIGGVALATLQGCGGPNNLETKVDMTDALGTNNDVDENDVAEVKSNIYALGTNNDVDENDVAEVKSNIAQTDAAENIGEKVVANVDLQKKTQQIWNAVMSKKGGAIAAGVALTGTLATAIGYKVKQHRAQAGRTCTAVGEGLSDKFVGVRYYDGQKVNFECATGYTLITDDEVTVECDANGEARITECSKNSLMILGKIFKPVAFLVLAGGLAYGAYLKLTPTETQKIQQEIIVVISEINQFVTAKESVKKDMAKESVKKDIENYVKMCYGVDGSSIKAKALAQVITGVPTKIAATDIETYVAKLDDFVNQEKEIIVVISEINQFVTAKESVKKDIEDYVKICYGADGSSIKAKALAKVMTGVPTKVAATDIEAYAAKLADFVNQERLKLQQEIIADKDKESVKQQKLGAQQEGEQPGPLVQH